jgi:mono/diheme cytochrome c family protein
MGHLIGAAIVFLGATVSLNAQAAQSSAAVLFNQQVQPILEQQCQSCHGKTAKQSGLDVTSRETLLRGGDHGPAVTPGKPEESLLYLYVKHERQPGMPFGGKKLSEEQIARIAEWIRAGAPFDEPLKTSAPKRAAMDHWAFRPPRRPAVPAVTDTKWVRNPIDAFLAAEQEKRGLKPVPEADRYTLLRRIYLDLAGIPPTGEQLHAFLADRSGKAYEKVVDQLLASPQYGERWGRHWMDIWRYSDWYGSGANEVRNSQRHIWRWRDWIIQSLNEDKGYDRMILEMLAGDEIAPGDPKVLPATGFLVRNWFRFNRNVWLQDTIESVTAAFLGVTLKCARCHDHKYDPIAQEEYYKFRAFFEPHDVRIDRVPGQADWKKAGLARVYDSLAKEALPPDPDEGTVNLLPPIFGETYLFVRGDEKNPDKDHPLSPAVPGALGKLSAEIKPIELSLESYYPDMRDFVPHDLVEQAKQRIRETESRVEKAKAQFASAKIMMAQPKRPEPPGEPVDFRKQIVPILEHRCFNCHQGRNRKSGLSVASEKEILSGGSKQGPAAIPANSAESPLVQYLRGEKQPRMPFNGPALPADQIELIARWIDRMPPKDPAVVLREAETKLQIGEKEIATARAALASLEARIQADKAKYRTPPDPEPETLAEKARMADQQASLVKCEENVLRAQLKLRDLVNEPQPVDEAGKNARERNIAAARKDLEIGVAALTAPKEGYTPVGKIYPKTSTGRRLALARWIGDKQNPLTARVAVNHMWLRHFGAPLVPTVTDFGKNGKPPINPELLDWLATELMNQNWSMKALHRLMVTSSAYRMQSALTAKHPNEAIDPENHWLWRMNTRRMEAEVVRDSVLHAAESLDFTIGGPELNEETDQDTPRRSLYFHITPSAQLLFLRVFDGSDPTNCYRRTESIVPQQALALANSKLSLTQSRLLAQRLGGAERSSQEFLTDAFESILGRPPSSAEMEKSLKFLERQQALLDRPKAVTPFQPQTEPPKSLNAKLRAREDLIHALFNRNEFVTIR